MARVAPREKIVVGLMMEGGSWVSMVLRGLAGFVVYRGRDVEKEEKFHGIGGICR